MVNREAVSLKQGQVQRTFEKAMKIWVVAKLKMLQEMLVVRRIFFPTHVRAVGL